MSNGKIRSSYQRRVLNWLLDGGATVSNIAEALSLQMPHASLALRQLRERGEVAREDQSGIRGAAHFITEIGRQRIEQDALSRLKANATSAPSQADGVVLGHDGQHVLLGYVKPLSSDLIRLPTYAYEGGDGDRFTSIGNAGGCWAIVRTESTQWYDFEELTPIASPPPIEQGTLTDWSSRNPAICVVHARLIDSTNLWNIPPGAWFQTPPQSDPSELVLEYGHHTLGHTIGNAVAVRPPMAVHGHLSSNVGRRLALNALSEGALRFEDHRYPGNDRTLPLEAIWYWLRRRHPRLATEKLELKFQDICRHLVGEMVQSPPITIQRAILSDFGKANWTLGEALSNINFSGTTSVGASSLLEWFLADTNIECTVEWNHQVEGNQLLLEEVLASQRCRLLLTSHGEPLKLAHTSATLKSTGVLGQVSLRLGRGKTLSLQLPESVDDRRSNAVHERTPATAQEMKAAHDGTTFRHEAFTIVETSLEQRKSIWHALSLHPNGDEEWANQNEASSPLASWIATPESERSSRWIRLRNVVPPGWADLLPVDSCETSTLIQAMPFGSPHWTLKALEKVRQRFTHNVESILRYEHFLEQDGLSEWMASAILLTSQHLTEEFHPMIQRSCELWLHNPHHDEQVLEAMFPLGSPLNEANQACLSMCLKAGHNRPKSTVLSMWSNAFVMLESNDAIQPEFLRSLMSLLPYSWWTAWAGDWLQIQLSSSSGRRWLRDQDIAWPALLARPPGERGGLPGMPTVHPAGRLVVEDVLQIHLVDDGPGKAALLDLHDMLATQKRNEPVHYGRLHPLVGWLSRPVDSWPSMNLEVLTQGNQEVGALLYARWFAHRLE